MSTTALVFAALVLAFLMTVTAKGQIPAYLAVLGI